MKSITVVNKSQAVNQECNLDKSATVPDETVLSLALLVDIRTLLSSIRSMMLFFTVLMAIYVVTHVIDTYQIPPIPESFLTLMGISNGVYLANKFLPASGLTRDQVLQKLTAAGYTAVADLIQAGDGGWTATATKDGGTGPVRIAKDGMVTAV